MRRVFGSDKELTEEMVDRRSEIMFYINVDKMDQDRAAIRIQAAVRRYWRWQLPFTQWGAQLGSFSTVPTSVVNKGMRERGGWSYLRRRSQNVGEFLDEDGEEWEEYVDNETSEYFYWQEDENRYLWDKPPLPKRTRKVIEYLKIGDEVNFKFPGKRDEEVAIVKKLKFDDETGLDMYDIEHKYNKELFLRWVPRMRIKAIPKGKY
tara:strand:+ start:218 stop:835 length:618 start_codon:yes stop_codon:yes gene_type:complete